MVARWVLNAHLESAFQGNASNHQSLLTVSLMLTAMKMLVKFAMLANASSQLLSDQVVLHQDSARLMLIVMQAKFAMLANASSQLSLDQVALIHLDQVVSLPSLDQVVLLQDSARPIPIVMQLKFVMLESASYPLL